MKNRYFYVIIESRHGRSFRVGELAAGESIIVASNICHFLTFGDGASVKYQDINELVIDYNDHRDAIRPHIITQMPFTKAWEFNFWTYADKRNRGLNQFGEFAKKHTSLLSVSEIPIPLIFPRTDKFVDDFMTHFHRSSLKDVVKNVYVNRSLA